MHTFEDALRRGERVAAARVALRDGDTAYTYSELAGRVRRIASMLDGLGTERGDRIAVLSANSAPFVELYLAVPASGRVLVPLNFRWADPELEYALRDSGSRVLVVDRDPGPLADLVEHVVRTDPDDDGPEYERLVADAPDTALGDAPHEDDLAGLFYTGGTTGASKGVMLTHRNLLANTFNMQMLLPFADDDVFLVMAPMFHAAGSISLLQAVFVGIEQVVLPGFDPGAALDLVAAHGVTGTIGVPTMIAGLVEEQLARPREVSSLRVIGHGGSPMPTETIRRAADAFPGTEFVHVYGATETAPLVTGLRHEERYVGTPRARSAGPAVVGVEIVIRDEHGEPVPDGEAGEVTVRGANVMAGYWNKPAETAAALRDGWYWSGDVGMVDAEGHLYLLDRSKDMIISGGENVYCGEVEEALYSHPAVLEAAVFGIPDEKWGEVVHAVVVPRAPVEAHELVRHCREQIAGYKVPRSITFRDEALPKSGPGKVLKRELRAPYWQGHEAQIG